jgi:DNA-binding GntR family transcriptional regulator
MIAMGTAAQAAPSRTVAEHVYAQIKADLLTGAFTPGAALLTRELLAR